MCFIIFRNIPNVLFVNDDDCGKCVWKYLIEESKIGYQSSTIENIKSNMCYKWILDSYFEESNLISKRSKFSPENSIENSICALLDKFIETNQHILMKSWSNLSNLKKILNVIPCLNNNLSCLLKSIQKSFNRCGNETNALRVNRNLVMIQPIVLLDRLNIFNGSISNILKLNGNLTEYIEHNEVNTRSLVSQIDDYIHNSQAIMSVANNNNQQILMKLSIVLLDRLNICDFSICNILKLNGNLTESIEHDEVNIRNSVSQNDDHIIHNSQAIMSIANNNNPQIVIKLPIVLVNRLNISNVSIFNTLKLNRNLTESI